jgi:hypothetical protein
MKKLIVLCHVILCLIICVPAISGRIPYEGRRIVGAQNEDGSYRTIPKVGEYYKNGAYVMKERMTNGDFIHQWIDTDNDEICDQITVWKPLDDPYWGRFYVIIQHKKCNGV